MAKKAPNAFIKAPATPPKLMYVRIDAAIQITDRDSYYEIAEQLDSVIDTLRGTGTAEVVELHEIVNTLPNASAIISKLRDEGDLSGEGFIGW